MFVKATTTHDYRSTDSALPVQNNVKLREQILNFVPSDLIKDELEILLTHANQITDYIVLGDYEALLSINPYHALEEGDYSACLGKNFKLVISLRSANEGDAPDAPDFARLGIRRERVFVGDEESGWPEIQKQFDRLFPLIDTARAKGEDILIHCTAGSSRSPAFVYAYLMYACQVTAEQAFKYVQSLRPQVQLGWFKEGLLAYQSTLDIKYF